jgi:exodeoxyribonuclease VII large subunit
VRVLERGFSLTQRADGRLLTRAADVAPGERVHVRLREGAFDATVDATPELKTAPGKTAPEKKGTS